MSVTTAVLPLVADGALRRDADIGDLVPAEPVKSYRGGVRNQMGWVSCDSAERNPLTSTGLLMEERYHKFALLLELVKTAVDQRTFVCAEILLKV